MHDRTPRIVLITGTTRGIGRALVKRLVELGHPVVGCARSPAGIHELSLEHSAPHRFDVVDVAIWQQVEAWAQGVLSV